MWLYIDNCLQCQKQTLQRCKRLFVSDLQTIFKKFSMYRCVLSLTRFVVKIEE